MPAEEVTHQSGISRLCNSIIVAFCLAPCLLLGMVIMLGWNERRAVCDARAIVEGEEAAEDVGCEDPRQGDSKLVFFSCDLSQQGLQPVQLPGSDFSFNYAGPLDVRSEMLQCVETSRSEERKDAVGGGTTKVTIYTYSVEWRSSPVNSQSFKGKYLPDSDWPAVCGVENPSLPSSVPRSGRVQVTTPIEAGAYTLDRSLESRLALSTSVMPSSVTGAWMQSGGTYTQTQGTPHNIGSVRVSFRGFDWSKPAVTVLGQNDDGKIGQWTASDSWLCSGFKLLDLQMGKVPKEKFFDNMRATNTAITYVLRFLGFILMWCAFKCFFGPLEVATDCIPCIGPCLGDIVEAVACVVSCPPACACALGVIGIVWVAMRPAVGLPLMLIFCCIMGAFAAFEVHAKMVRQTPVTKLQEDSELA